MALRSSSFRLLSLACLAIIITIAGFLIWPDSTAEPGPSEAPLPESVQIGNSGLPVPRMVSLGSTEINMRTGPGTRYPIKWVYTRKGLPVKVEAEFDIWRKIRDRDGETGWVHGSMLSGRRTVEITSRSASKITQLYDQADGKSAPVLRAEDGVIAELVKCRSGWCELRVEGKKGWARRTALWGVMPADDKQP